MREFCANVRVPVSGEVTDKVWSALVDASYNLGDRTLYLRMPYFHGHDVLSFSRRLAPWAFFCGVEDAIFGAHTELALRNLQLTWGFLRRHRGRVHVRGAEESRSLMDGEGRVPSSAPCGISLERPMLETHALCLFGTDEFTLIGGVAHVQLSASHQPDVEDRQRRRAVRSARRHDAARSRDSR